MRALRSRVIPSSSAETPIKKSEQSTEIDTAAPASDGVEVVGTPSQSSVPAPDSGAPRSASVMPQPRRSLRLASAASRRGGGASAEGLPLPLKSCPWKGVGSGEGASPCEGEKVEAFTLGRRGGMSDRQNIGKRKLEDDASLIDSKGSKSLRSRKSVTKRAAHSDAENLVNAFDIEENQWIMLSKITDLDGGDTENREKGSCNDEVGSFRSRKILRREDKGKDKIGDNEVIGLGAESSGSKPGGIGDQPKYGAEEIGKAKIVCDNMLSDCSSVIDLDMEINNLRQKSESIGQEFLNVAVAQRKSHRVKAVGESSSSDIIRRNFRNIARRSASRFAHFNPDDEGGNNSQVKAERNASAAPRPADPEPEDWPGPFSTAMKIIRDRGTNVSTLQSNSFFNKWKSPIIWAPRRDRHTQAKRLIPSLLELCLNVLAANANAITSLDGVPDMPRHKLSQLLCDSRKMNKHFFDLLVGGSPTEIRVKDSSWLTEEELSESFKRCDTRNIMVLQLDQCGRCLPDYAISSISCSASCFPALSTISITGACRLTDDGLATLISSAPSLRSINISQCSLLTASSIVTLANKVGSLLRELYIDDCQSIDAMLILPALKRLENLQVLSVAGISSVSDDFVVEFVAQLGHNLRELVLSDCTNLTDASIKTIAEVCPGLLALNLVNLTKLTDSAVGYLANGCQALEKLILCRNTFSDEGIAAFLEASGELLQELSLNNVKKVSTDTAISLAKKSRKLQSLDLSWCRNMTDEAFGLIVDSCSCLKELKVFGCTQITDTFLNGHSNAEVKIVGLKMAPLLEHCRVLIPDNPLKY
ncbi:hypothetical protein SAY86_009549 [Trapa natans]|uniref:F-box/LRR-repeat protein 15-like leucin rich repeat domain-containing protein n=1 Tax=Trapa natans TaxID=22666 RepID=A0AAN7KZX2_TRANT|nr:hypothetical protein SAY86_009549 [Trapa natans]